MPTRQNIFVNKLLVPFVKAWNLFFEIPFPISNKLNNKINSTCSTNEESILYAVPLIGLVVGIIAYVFILIMYLLFGAILAAILCSIIIMLICEILSYGGDTNNLVHSLTNRSFAASRKSAEEQQSLKEGNYLFIYLFIYIFIAVFLLRIVCLGVIIYDHNFSWIIIIVTLSMTTQGFLAINSSDSLINISDKKSNIIVWIIPAVICIIFGWYVFAATAIAYILTLAISIQMKRHLNNSNSLFGDNIGVSGKYIEILVLIIGLIAVTQH